MRICYIADGLSIHTQRWVNYFAERGHEVHLISSRFTPGYERYDKRIKMHPPGQAVSANMEGFRVPQRYSVAVSSSQISEENKTRYTRCSLYYREWLLSQY